MLINSDEKKENASDTNSENEIDSQAVAIKYDAGTDTAPKVVAKGRSLVADRILAEAKKHGVPVYQNKSLVNMLMALEIDREIPPELYRSIAEILAHVYRLDKKIGTRGENRDELKGKEGSSKALA